jgi:hypothetical protein
LRRFGRYVETAPAIIRNRTLVIPLSERVSHQILHLF